MRLATWNILSGMSPSQGFVGADRLREEARRLDVDVLAVQEVDARQPRSQGVDLTAVLADGLGAAYHRFAPALIGTPGLRWRPARRGGDGRAEPAYGVSLISRFPVRSWRVLALPAAPVRSPILLPGTHRVIWLTDEPRVALAAVIEVPTSTVAGGLLTVVSTHLSFAPGWNAHQLRRLAGQLEHLPAPRLVLGDLNLPGSLAARVSGLRSLARHATYPAPRPRIQFDHALGSRDPDLLRVVASHTREMDLSDHRALVVELAG